MHIYGNSKFLKEVGRVQGEEVGGGKLEGKGRVLLDEREGVAFWKEGERV